MASVVSMNQARFKIQRLEQELAEEKRQRAAEHNERYKEWHEAQNDKKEKWDRHTLECENLNEEIKRLKADLQRETALKTEAENKYNTTLSSNANIQPASTSSQTQVDKEEIAKPYVDYVIAEAKVKLDKAREEKEAMIEQYWKDMEEKDTQISQLRTQFQGLLAETEPQISQYQNQVQSTIEEKDSQIAQLQSKVEEVTTEKDAEIAELQIQIRGMTIEKQELEARVENYRVQEDELRKQLANRTAEWTAACQTTVENEKKLNEEEQRRAVVEKERDDFNEQLNTLKAQIQKQQQAPIIIQTQDPNSDYFAGPSSPTTLSKSTANVEHHNSRKGPTTSTEDLRPLERNLREALAKNAEKDKRISKLEKELEKELEKGLQETRSTINDAKNKMTELEEQLAQSNLEVEILQEDLRRERRRALEDDDIQHLQTLVDIRDEIIESKDEVIQRKNQEKAELQKQLDDLRKKVNARRSSRTKKPDFFNVLFVVMLVGLFGLGDWWS
jgi:hypothetical protein